MTSLDDVAEGGALATDAILSRIAAERVAYLKGAECEPWVRAKLLASAALEESHVALIACRNREPQEIHHLLLGACASLKPCICVPKSESIIMRASLNANPAVSVAPCEHARAIAQAVLGYVDARGVRFMRGSAAPLVLDTKVVARTPFEIAIAIGAFNAIRGELTVAGDLLLPLDDE
jgi:hypothetical protein